MAKWQFWFPLRCLFPASVAIVSLFIQLLHPPVSRLLERHYFCAVCLGVILPPNCYTAAQGHAFPQPS